MNQQAPNGFLTENFLQRQRTAMHYQMRDNIVLPIIRELRHRGLPVSNLSKDRQERFTFTATPDNQTVHKTEALELKIESNGALTFSRYIPCHNGRAPVECMTVQPLLKNEKQFMSLIRTMAFELSRFYDKKHILSHALYANDPRGAFQKIAIKGISTRYTP